MCLKVFFHDSPEVNSELSFCSVSGEAVHSTLGTADLNGNSIKPSVTLINTSCLNER